MCKKNKIQCWKQCFPHDKFSLFYIGHKKYYFFMKLDAHTYIMEMYMSKFFSKFFHTLKYVLLVEGAYAPGSRIEFPKVKHMYVWLRKDYTKILKQKICTYIFTCYALTKSFHKKWTYHVTCVKKTKFSAENNAFHMISFLFFT